MHFSQGAKGQRVQNILRPLVWLAAFFHYTVSTTSSARRGSPATAGAGKGFLFPPAVITTTILSLQQAAEPLLPAPSPFVSLFRFLRNTKSRWFAGSKGGPPMR